MAKLTLQLLGPYQATLEGRPISGFDSDKVRALLAYLAVEAERPHRRQSLVGLFWPDFSESSARTNLRRALSNLRQILKEKVNDKKFLIVTRHSVQFNRQTDYDLDVETFSSLIKDEISHDNSFHNLQDAYHLYKGDFLEGFSLSDCVTFEEWALVTRQSLRERFAWVLHQLATCYEERQDYKNAQALAHKQVKLDPYHEEAHQQLMRVLAHSGQRNKALQHYKELSQLLEKDLGVGPSVQSQEVHRWLQTETFPVQVKRAARTYSHNLPAQISQFIGRKREIAEVKGLVENYRLTTLIGSPGTGKSRLALEAASSVSDMFSDGQYFKNLAPITDPTLVASTIAQILEIREHMERPLVETIKESLGARQLLLLLDNYEQVIESATVISDLLAACQNLKVLVTSREPLRIYGEQEYFVHPLTVPDLDQSESLASLSQYEALQLFLHRARAVNRQFSITEDNALTIAQICVRLDGLPLAIELAAARCKILSPEMIQQRIERRFSTLGSGARDLPPRQRTLRAAIDWSFELLDPNEKRLFTELAVFQGGRDLEAIEAVCGQNLTIDPIDGLESLLNKSVIQQIEGQEGELRYVMLETIHEYARERLEETGTSQELYERHADYFVALVERAEPELYGDRLPYWCNRLRVEFDNIRAALSWSLSRGDPMVGLRLVGSLREFWHGEGHISEGLRWAAHVLELSAGAPLVLRSKALNTAGLFASAMGERRHGEQLHLEALALSRESGDTLNQAWVLLFLARNITSWRDRSAEGTAYCQEALALFRELAFKPGIMQSLNMLGELARVAGDYQRAKEAYEDCLEEGRESGHRLRYLLTSGNLHYIAQHEGDYKRAEAIILEVLPSLIELGLKYHIAAALAMLVGPLAGQGEPERAARLLGASGKILRSMGGRLPPADQSEVDNYVAGLKDQLEPNSFEAAIKEGEAMSFEETIDFAFRREEHLFI